MRDKRTNAIVYMPRIIYNVIPNNDNMFYAAMLWKV